MRVILVGGFLGAGKTTLLREAAKRLKARNLSVGLVTNDQVPDLVDTALLGRSSVPVREVAGSCFCCNFKGLADALHSLQAAGSEYVLAEPVGSCTDLAATVVQPARAYLDDCDMAPLSVLLDPARVRQVLQEKHPRLHADAAYILRLQLEEADQILLNKSDTLTEDARKQMIAYLSLEFSGIPVVPISAKTGEGLDDWLDAVLGSDPVPSRLLEVDYDRYAHGEAVLGWMNTVVALRWIGGLQPDWEAFSRHFLELLQLELQQISSEIGHIKLLLECTDGELYANLVSLDGTPSLQSDTRPGRLDATLTLNARVQTPPEVLERAFREALRAAAHARVAPEIRSFHCIRPGRPVPTYRLHQPPA